MYHSESLALCRELEDTGGIAMAYPRLGIVAQQQGDYLSARAHHAQTLALWREAGYQHGVAECLDQLAVMTAAQGQPRKAARLFGAAEALLEACGGHMWPADRADYERNVAAARATLGMPPSRRPGPGDERCHWTKPARWRRTRDLCGSPEARYSRRSMTWGSSARLSMTAAPNSLS